MDSLLTQRVLLTSAETAELRRVDRRTVWRWGTEGRLGAVRLGPNTVRYRAESVSALMAGKSDPNRANAVRQSEKAQPTMEV